MLKLFPEPEQLSHHLEAVHVRWVDHGQSDHWSGDPAVGGILSGRNMVWALVWTENWRTGKNRKNRSNSSSDSVLHKVFIIRKILLPLPVPTFFEVDLYSEVLIKVPTANVSTIRPLGSAENAQTISGNFA